MKVELVDKTIALVGKRGSGKTRLLWYLIYCNRNKFDKIFLISPTNTDIYQDIIEKKICL